MALVNEGKPSLTDVNYPYKMTKAESLDFSAVEIRSKNMLKKGYYKTPTPKVLKAIIY